MFSERQHSSKALDKREYGMISSAPTETHSLGSSSSLGCSGMWAWILVQSSGNLLALIFCVKTTYRWAREIWLMLPGIVEIALHFLRVFFWCRPISLWQPQGEIFLEEGLAKYPRQLYFDAHGDSMSLRNKPLARKLQLGMADRIHVYLHSSTWLPTRHKNDNDNKKEIKKMKNSTERG